MSVAYAKEVQGFVFSTEADNAKISALMDSNGSRIFSIIFVKKDGTLRRMACQLTAGRDLLVNSERGQRATATRKVNNPHLRSVYDIGKRAWRTVNLNTVLTVKACGRIHRIRNLHVARQMQVTVI